MGSRSTAHISVTHVECFPKIKTSQILFLLFALFLPLIFRRLLCQPLLLPPIQLVAIFLFNTKWILSLYSLSSGRCGYNLKAVWYSMALPDLEITQIGHLDFSSRCPPFWDHVSVFLYYPHKKLSWFRVKHVFPFPFYTRLIKT